jgi:hypothetical protein
MMTAEKIKTIPALATLADDAITALRALQERQQLEDATEKLPKQ